MHSTIVNAIEVSHLRRTFKTNIGVIKRTAREVIAVDDISFEIQEGELFGLLGPNGAGKTTTVKMLTTLLIPTSGSAAVKGFDVVARAEEVRRRIGFIFGGERGLYWRLSGVDNLRYFASLYSLDPDVTKKRILYLLDMVGLNGRGDEKVQGYSRGLEAVKKAGVIKVGTSADYPPFESVDENGNKVGFDIDLMTEVAKRLGVKVEWVDMPFDSLIAAVQEGKIDASISAFNYSEERDKMIDFSDAYYNSEDSFTVAENFAGTITNPEDVAAYKVGVQTGTTQDSWLTDNLVAGGKLPEENLFRYDRVDQAMLDLQNGRIDILMSDYVPAQVLAKKLGGLKIVYHGVLGANGPMNIVIPDGDAELQQAINEIIKQLQDEGFIDALAVKYFAE